MRIQKAFAGIAMVSALVSFGSVASAHPPADDFLNPQKPGPHLTLMPFIGPGFRATYDHRFEVEEDMSEIRTQVIGTVALPFSEISANVDARFFLMTFGGGVGYHDEWHTLQFNPDSQTGRDRGGVPRFETDPTIPTIATDPTPGYSDLHRDARVIKDQNADYTVKRWAFEELRWGFLVPGYSFMGVSQFAFHHNARPDVSYDWEQGTVMNGGWNIRWEGYALFRGRNFGFIGPAFRALVVPRNRTRGSHDGTVTPSGLLLPYDSACQPGVVQGVVCAGTHEFEFHYGILAGLRPNWINANDTFLFRAYTTYGLNNILFGTHTFRQPIQLLFAYMADFDL
ncbi:MAG TPA: hypothetical protein VHE30_23330 [Polyangiaceae bacterium]|nr:hypothetical protein [Polyangiaceae bacterium]